MGCPNLGLKTAIGSERTMSHTEGSTLRVQDYCSSSETASQSQHLEDEMKSLKRSISLLKPQVTEQDTIIKNLRTYHDKIVQDFESNRTEEEKTIEILIARCEEAEKNSTENELALESIQKKEIKELQQNIDTLKLKEGDARLELEKIRTQLVEAELNKERDLTELSTQHYLLKKYGLELKLAQRKKELQEERMKHENECRLSKK